MARRRRQKKKRSEQQQCPLFPLPAEFRSQTYDHVLAPPDDECLVEIFHQLCQCTPSPLALLQTCHRIYNEAVEMYHEKNWIVIPHRRAHSRGRHYHYVPVLETFLSEISPRRLQAIRHLSVPVIGLPWIKEAFQALSKCSSLRSMCLLREVFEDIDELQEVRSVFAKEHCPMKIAAQQFSSGLEELHYQLVHRTERTWIEDWSSVDEAIRDVWDEVETH